MQGFVYALDIAQLMGDKMPACKDSDYEQWTVPADDRTPRCLLGKHAMRTEAQDSCIEVCCAMHSLCIYICSSCQLCGTNLCVLTCTGADRQGM